MIKKLMQLSLLGCSALMAEKPHVPAEPQAVEQEFGYVNVGVGFIPFPGPAVGVGVRTQKGVHGADLSVQAMTTVIYNLEVSTVTSGLLYLHYFNPSLSSEIYAGAGLSAGVLFGNDVEFFTHHYYNPLLAPEIIIGKQYRTKSDSLHFFQMQMLFPPLVMNHSIGVLPFPLMMLSYGVGF